MPTRSASSLANRRRGHELRLMLVASAFAIDLEFFEDKGRAGPD